MNIEELQKKYESVCEEADNARISYNAHMWYSISGKKTIEIIEFHKSYKNIYIILKKKEEEKIKLIKSIKEKTHLILNTNKKLNIYS